MAIFRRLTSGSAPCLGGHERASSAACLGFAACLDCIARGVKRGKRHGTREASGFTGAGFGQKEVLTGICAPGRGLALASAIGHLAEAVAKTRREPKLAPCLAARALWTIAQSRSAKIPVRLTRYQAPGFLLGAVQSCAVLPRERCLAPPGHITRSILQGAREASGLRTPWPPAGGCGRQPFYPARVAPQKALC